MSLRIRFHLLVGLLILAAISHLLIIHWSNKEARSQWLEARSTTDIVISLSALRYLSLEFRLQQSDRTRQQWYRKHATLAQQLSESRMRYTAAELQLLDQISQNHVTLASLFSQADVPPAWISAGAEREHQERVTRQILARIQYMIDDCTRLSNLSRASTEAAIERSYQRMIYAVMFLLAVLGALIGSLYVSMLRPLDTLLAAARAIANGDSGVRLPHRKDPDFGLLFQAFNDMVQNLEGSLAQLKDANRALLLSNQDLSRFAYVASHDLQTPLRGIAGFVQLIEADYGHLFDDEGRSWLLRIRKSTSILQETIRDLLNYSRLESNTRPFEVIPLGEVLESVKGLLEAAIQESGATIKHGDLPTLYGDPTQLAQLLQNLLTNAIKFRSNDSPLIDINWETKDGREIIRVQDNGIGIPPAYQKKVFEMFQRLHAQSRFPGTGIGLTICQRIMQRHNGEITVESDGIRGSTFILSFPVHSKSEAP